MRQFRFVRFQAGREFRNTDPPVIGPNLGSAKRPPTALIGGLGGSGSAGDKEHGDHDEDQQNVSLR